MYKHYIKTDENNNVVDSFANWQHNKFDGSEIEIAESVDRHFCLVLKDGESYKFKYVNSNIIEKTQAEKENSLEFVAEYKKQKKQELKQLIRDNWPLEINRTIAQIRTQWANIKAQASEWTTKAEVDAAFATAVAWLGL